MPRISYLVAAGLFCLPIPAQAAPGPDLKVEKSCTLDPAAGPTAVSCFIEVTNVGTVPSVSPVTLSDTVTAPAGTTLLNSPNGLGCNTPAGPVPATILCSDSQSIAAGKSQSSSLKFALPTQGGVFKNCVTVAQGQSPTTPADPDLANNTSCSTVNVPGSGTGTGAPGTITIVKDGLPNTSLDIGFSSNIPGFPTFYLDDDSDSQLSNKQVFTVPSGTTYIFTEDEIPGWWLQSIACTGAGTGGQQPSWDLATRTLAVPLAAGQNITCKFTNQLGQRIRIQKASVPASLENFNFEGSGPGFFESFVLDADAGVPGADNVHLNSIQFNVQPGSFTFTELPNGNSTLVGIACNPSTNVTYDLAGRSVTIQASGHLADPRITCVFKNKMKPTEPKECTGYPLSATVNIFTPGWETVHICRGGTVTFSKTVAPAMTASSLDNPASFVAVPLGNGTTTGTTSPFPIAGTYLYSLNVPTTNGKGQIIVHD